MLMATLLCPIALSSSSGVGLPASATVMSEPFPVLAPLGSGTGAAGSAGAAAAAGSAAGGSAGAAGAVSVCAGAAVSAGAAAGAWASAKEQVIPKRISREIIRFIPSFPTMKFEPLSGFLVFWRACSARLDAGVGVGRQCQAWVLRCTEATRMCENSAIIKSKSPLRNMDFATFFLNRLPMRRGTGDRVLS